MKGGVTDLLDFQWKTTMVATEVAKSSPDHGPRHWRDVARIAYCIGDEVSLSREEMWCAFYFACVHDTQRENEYYDPEHGERAARMLGMGIGGPVLQHEVLVKRLTEALVGHDKGTVAGTDFLQMVCWDADRLTLGRVGIEPDVQYMSSSPVKHNFDHWLQLAEGIRTGEDKDWFSIAELYSEYGE